MSLFYIQWEEIPEKSTIYLVEKFGSIIKILSLKFLPETTYKINNIDSSTNNQIKID